MSANSLDTPLDSHVPGNCVADDQVHALDQESYLCVRGILTCVALGCGFWAAIFGILALIL